MTGADAYASLTIPCTGPAIRGSATWLHPTRAEWKVYIHGDFPQHVNVYVTITGTRELGGSAKARGQAAYELDDTPEWLRIPGEWIKDATELCYAHLYQDAGKEDTP